MTKGLDKTAQIPHSAIDALTGKIMYLWVNQSTPRDAHSLNDLGCLLKMIPGAYS